MPRDAPPSQPNGGQSLRELPARFWIALVATGVGAGAGAMAMIAVLRAVQHAAFDYTTGEYSVAAARSGDVRRLVVLVVGGAVAGAGWWILRRKAGGTGGDPTVAVWTGQPDLTVVRTTASGALSEVVIGLGASLGREAAPQQVGAASGSWLGRHLGLADEQCVLLVACGAGAGMGAVYNVPFAGALFTAEVYLGALSIDAVVPALVTSGIATVVAWITLPPHFLYSLPTASFPRASAIVFALVAGPILGLAAAGFVRLVAWAYEHRPTGNGLLFEPVLAFAVLGVAAFEYPLVLGNGRDLAQFAFDGTGALATMAALVVLKPALTALCLRSGAAGGTFTPAFSFGAVLGATMGHLWSYVWAGTPPATYALVGAGAVIGSAMQAPLSGLAFTIELTGTANASIVVVVLALVGAMITYRRVESRSVYSARSEHSGNRPA